MKALICRVRGHKWHPLTLHTDGTMSATCKRCNHTVKEQE